MNFCNNVGINTGCYLINEFLKSTAKNAKTCNARNYHMGLKGLFNDNNEDTIFKDGNLIVAEGMSVRWLYFR